MSRDETMTVSEYIRSELARSFVVVREDEWPIPLDNRRAVVVEKRLIARSAFRCIEEAYALRIREIIEELRNGLMHSGAYAVSVSDLRNVSEAYGIESTTILKLRCDWTDNKTWKEVTWPPVPTGEVRTIEEFDDCMRKLSKEWNRSTDKIILRTEVTDV